MKRKRKARRGAAAKPKRRHTTRGRSRSVNRGVATRPAPRAPTTHDRISVEPFGVAVRLDYTRGKGKTYTHAFRKGTRVYVTTDHKHLIIAPVKVRNNQIED